MYSGRKMHVDGPLLMGVLALCVLGLVLIFSASGENWNLMWRQGIRLLLSLGVMLAAAQIPPEVVRRLSPHIFIGGLLILVLVLVAGYVGKGAQRWLDLGVFRFQPSELMKLGVPMAVAWLLTRRAMPPRFLDVLGAILIIALPALLVVVQPDLGTAIMLVVSGLLVLFLGGIRWQHLLMLIGAAVAAAPYLWAQLHHYQQQRILTMFDPWSDPLGSGYHAIQSMIAIGSAGLAGKGWLAGSQSHLEFIPERSTDFIFAVFAEEFGLVGVVALVTLYVFLVGRCLVMAYHVREVFSRLLIGGLALTFFSYFFVNAAMVAGMLPVVGVPLPLVSYGGTSMLTLMAAFGIMMGAYTRRGLMT